MICPDNWAEARSRDPDLNRKLFIELPDEDGTNDVQDGGTRAKLCTAWKNNVSRR